MNLLDEDFSKKNDNKTKNIIRVIVILIILVIIVIVGIICYMMYLERTRLKVVLNGQQNEDIKNLLVIEDDGTIYVPVRAISSYFGYSSYNGEYTDRSEDNSRCYVQSEDEVANLTLNSNKVYKLNLVENQDEYSYIYMDKPVKAIDGQLYITTDGMQKVFNTTFEYNESNNTYLIDTIPYLTSIYQTAVLNYGYTGLSDNFENEKAMLKNILVVTDGTSFGVINGLDGTEILECKYDDILYEETIGDFVVSSNGKWGIIGTDQRTKVEINYDSIMLIDYDAGLYLVRRNNLYGVVDLNGNTVIYPENDQIGVDISRFEENDLKTGYILLDKVIPVMRDNKWGLFDLQGNQIVGFEYDSFGYISSNSREATSLLVIPNYNVIVACLDGRYTLLDTSGEQPIKAFVDDMYMVISGGEKSYVMIVNDRSYDVEEYLDRMGTQSSSTNTTTDNSTTENNEQTDNQVNDETSEENSQDSEEQTNNGEEQQTDEQQPAE